MSQKVKIVNQSPFQLPAYATSASAGMDLYAFIDDDTVLKSMERILVPTGIYIELPEGYEAQIRPRSGLAYRHGITVLNSPGTIDADYRGEIKVLLINLGKDPYAIEPGSRIAQMVIAQFAKIIWEEVEILETTDRGAGGFGHTGS